MPMYPSTMTLSSTSLALLLAAALCTTVLARSYSRNRRLPPKPPGLPILGNALQMPTHGRHIKLLEWARQYGDIYRLQLGPQSLVYLNSADAANELLSKRARNYAMRPHIHVAFDLLSDGQRMVLMPAGEEWKVARKSVGPIIGGPAIPRIRNLEELESRTLLYDLLNYGDRAIRQPINVRPGTTSQVPEDHWFFLIRRFSTSIIMNIVYAERIHRLQGLAHVSKIFDILSNFLRVAQPGRYAADAFPFMRLLPDFLAKWRVEGRAMHEWEMDLFGGLLDEHKANVKGGMTRDCFISMYLHDRADHGHEDAPGKGITDDGWMRDKFLAYTAGSLLEAGSDTTTTTIEIFLLYMLNFPEHMKKAQEEIDEVVGPDRMPIWEDQDRLPYLMACIKESIRVQPALTVGLPHAAEEDDEYNGYFIPEGTVVVGNVYSIHMDPVKFPDPTAFKPERWYTSGEPTRMRSGPEAKDRDTYIFGWGRRFCAGQQTAELSLYITCSRILWAFDMLAPWDPKTGQPIIPDLDDMEQTWTNETINAPKIFPVIWKTRDETRAELIRRSWQEAQDQWRALGLQPDLR